MEPKLRDILDERALELDIRYGCRRGRFIGALKAYRELTQRRQGL